MHAWETAVDLPRSRWYTAPVPGDADRGDPGVGTVTGYHTALHTIDALSLRPAGLLSRPVLRQRLDEGLATCRLALLVAPAGYGKTTLLNEWIRRETRSSCVYYPLSDLDNDAPHLLAGLRAGIRGVWPSEIIPPFLSAEAEAQGPLSYLLASLFQQAAEFTRREWLLLLDDYHHVTSSATHQALDMLLLQPAWPVHILIAGRGLPPLTAIARLRVEGHLLELDENDLRFSPEEAREVLADGGLALEEEAVRQVAARTEGWPVAVQLLRQAAQRATNPDLTSLLDRMGDERPLFDYLAGQVLDHQPAAVQSFLRRTALLPYLSADLCDAFLERTDASAVLDNLERSHLFVSPLGDRPGRCYRYHALFQDLLQRSLEQVEGAQAVTGWHRRAAAVLLEDRGEIPGPHRVDDQTAAIEHLLAAREWKSAAQRIETLIETLDFGALPRLEPWFERLPPDMVAGRPRLLLALGRIHERQGRWAEALRVLKQAEKTARSTGTPADLVLSLRWQAWVHYRQDRYAEAVDLCHRALGYVPGAPRIAAAPGHTAADIPSDPAHARELAGIYNILANCSSALGDLEQGLHYYLASLQLFRRLGNREREAVALHNLAAGIYLPQGRLRETLSTEQTSLRILEELHSYRACFPLITLGQTYLQCGDLEAAHAVLERLLRLTDTYQDPPRRGYALYLLGHLHREQGDRAAARRCYDEAHIIAEQVRERFMLFELHHGLAHLALDDGDLHEARRQSLAALEHAREPLDNQLQGQALATLGHVLERSGDTSEAEAHYRQALLLVEGTGSHLDQAAIHLHLADLCRQEGRDAESLAHLGDSLAISDQYGYDFLFVGRERGRALPLLVAALGQTSEVLQTPEVFRLLVAIGPGAVEPLLALLATAPVEVQERVVHLLGEIGDERAVPALSALRQHRRLREPVHAALARIATAPQPPLRVRSLGGFEVRRGEVPIPAEAWQRRKTRLLLLYLLTRHGPIPCDEVLEVLWPELSPESAGQALNTTFSELRRILEPHLSKGMASRYLERDQETLSFRRDSTFWYDAAAFEQAVRAGGPAARQSLELYRGDFLPEEPYVDWVLRERERFRTLHLNALTAWLEERIRAGLWR
jgi:LuxR family maltose regulon positive regulatory protein